MVKTVGANGIKSPGKFKKNFAKNKVPLCVECGEPMVKIEEQSSKYHSTWKLDCECVKKNPELGDLRLTCG